MVRFSYPSYQGPSNTPALNRLTRQNNEALLDRVNEILSEVTAVKR